MSGAGYKGKVINIVPVKRTKTKRENHFKNMILLGITDAATFGLLVFVLLFEFSIPLCITGMAVCLTWLFLFYYANCIYEGEETRKELFEEKDLFRDKRGARG